MVRTFTLVALVIALTACGSTQEPEPDHAARATRTEEPAAVDDGMVVEGLRGTLQRDEVDPVLNRASRRFQQCYIDAYADHPYLVGTLRLQFTVGGDGSVQTVWVQSSTLGSSEVESCILGIARSLSFPHPHGGSEANFEYGPMELSSDDHHPFDEWTAADLPSESEDDEPPVTEVISGVEDTCLSGDSGYGVTAYIGPGGRVRSIEAVAPSASQQDHARCLERELADIAFPDPGEGRIAKLTLEL